MQSQAKSTLDSAILFVSRMPPNAQGPGGTQRAFYMLETLSKLGPVDVLILCRTGDREAEDAPSEDALKLARSYNKIKIAEWASLKTRWQFLPGRWKYIYDYALLGPSDVPRFSSQQIEKIAEIIPNRSYNIIFAERLSSAVIVDQLLERKLLSFNRRIADLDDILSKYKQREMAVNGSNQNRLHQIIQRATIKRLKDAELKVSRTWSATGMPAYEDVVEFKSAAPNAHIQQIPNVINKPLLAIDKSKPNRVLFVGHLGYPPNVQGLSLFLKDAWPKVLQAIPDAVLDVVGMYPDALLSAKVSEVGGRLHPNVPSVTPYYETAAVVISPIYIASGTRIKIIEAFAYGRPVVSTTLGAEGLGAVSGTHLLLADDASLFAESVVKLCRDSSYSQLLCANAKKLQEDLYSSKALELSILEMSGGTTEPQAEA